ncbi:MAG: transporter substrate-binding domain-containing protein [Clostridiales bacterium]|nr:transporter substrate-binding domain-containing protein [Clostridiales bacterium]
MKKILIFAAVFTILLHIAGCAGKMPANTVFSEDDLNGKDIGMAKGTAAMFYADGYGELRSYESAETMLVDLKNGILDCVVMDENHAKTLIKKVSGLKILEKPLVESEFCFAIAKENPDLLEAVNGALKELDECGMLKKIIEGYHPGNDFRYKSPENTDLSRGTLILAVDAVIPPYSYFDKDGQPVGLDIDIARAVCDILQVKMEVTVVHVSDRIITVQYGKADFSLGGVTYNEKDGKLVVFSDPYTTCTQVIVTRR